MANAWLLRATIPDEDPKKTVNLIPIFQKNNLIAIGWNDLGNLGGKTKDEIKQAVSDTYGLERIKLGNTYAVINLFVNDMQIGDLVIVPNGGEIYFAEIVSDYIFNDSSELSLIPHTRKVEWKGVVLRDDLPEELRKSLRVLRTAANLTRHHEGFTKVINGTYIDTTPQNIYLEYPLRPDFIVKFSIPKDMTATEADRLSKYIATLYFD